MNSEPSSTPDELEAGRDQETPLYRQPSNWFFPKQLQQVRQKRGFTTAEAAQVLPSVSESRLRRWESGLQSPTAFTQTYVIWRLNTASQPRVSVPAPPRFSWRAALVPGLPVLLFALAIILVSNGSLQGERSQNPLSLPEAIALSASQAQGHAVSPEAYAGYADRLESTLDQYNPRDRQSIFGDLSELVEGILD